MVPSYLDEVQAGHSMAGRAQRSWFPVCGVGKPRRHGVRCEPGAGGGQVSGLT